LDVVFGYHSGEGATLLAVRDDGVVRRFHYLGVMSSLTLLILHVVSDSEDRFKKITG